MNKLEKIIIIGLLILPASALALDTSSSLSISSLGQSIVNAVWIVFTVIAVICFVIAGIMFLTAMGDSEKVAKARSMALWGVAGIVVGILAFSIVTLVQGTIGA